MIRRCEERDLEAIWAIVNDGAVAYKGIIPADRWHEPYMTREELRREIDDGVVFWGYEAESELAGVMGIQPVEDVTLIRHAYVRTARQNQGIGARLLAHMIELTSGPLLVGTWRDAAWAIRFYEKHEFTMLSDAVYQNVIRRYWKIPQRQIETSVVLADRKWLDLNPMN
jgi:GNAT superfamily N-acetyltransferase